MSVIDDRYAALGGANGFLGAIASDEQPTSDGKARYRLYEHGAIYWLVYDPTGGGPGTKTYEVHGAIWEKYQLGAKHGVMDPRTNQPAIRNVFYPRKTTGASTTTHSSRICCSACTRTTSCTTCSGPQILGT